MMHLVHVQVRRFKMVNTGRQAASVAFDKERAETSGFTFTPDRAQLPPPGSAELPSIEIVSTFQVGPTWSIT
jgi:hypothetical protein